MTLTRRQVDPTIRPESRRLAADPRVGYLRVVSLAGQWAIDGIAEALTDFVGGDDAIDALVLDLRASNQGAPLVMTELLRAFVSGNVGEFHSRTGNEPIEVEPNDLAAAYASMPIVVLVDEASEAEAEQAAAILQDQGRATIIGTQTYRARRTAPRPSTSRTGRCCRSSRSASSSPMERPSRVAG